MLPETIENNLRSRRKFKSVPLKMHRIRNTNESNLLDDFHARLMVEESGKKLTGLCILDQNLKVKEEFKPLIDCKKC